MRTLIDGMRDGPGQRTIDSNDTEIRRINRLQMVDQPQIRRVVAVTRMRTRSRNRHGGRKSVTSLVDNIDEILRLSESDVE